MEKWYKILQDKYLNRRKRSTKLNGDTNLKEYVHSKLQSGWSPWQIEGRLKLENSGNCVISHETIYRYIYSDYGIRNMFYEKLRRKHFWRVKRNSRKPRVPKEMLINNRIAIKNIDKTASGTAITLISTAKKFKKYFKSITFDQGSEFNKYEWINECFGTKIYFCKPASPYQKGAVENGNGVIRAELPRNFDIATLKQKHIALLIEEINNRLKNYACSLFRHNSYVLLDKNNELSTVLKSLGE